MQVKSYEYFDSILDELCSTSTESVELADDSLMLLRERYLRPGDDGPAETPETMFRRVARALARAEEPEAVDRWENAFYEIMARLEFHPGSRTLANAGTPHQQLANCFVFPFEDSQSAILTTLSQSSVIKGFGGGCGFNYSKIRPRGDEVRGLGGMASGPVALLQLFDQATQIFRQRGRYESGNMAILDVDHPDVMEFIEAKRDDGVLSLTNISLGISDAFMRAVEADSEWHLVNPRTGEPSRVLPARDIFRAAAKFACDTGDPGLIFLDRINDDNPLREGLGDISATNTCGEIGLYDYESCNLAYINLPKFLLPGREPEPELRFDWDRLRTVIAAGVRMIDDAISVSEFPFEQIREAVSANRRIGIGVTGWADCLAAARIPYDSEEALAQAESLAGFIFASASEASRALARERGPFPNVRYSSWKDGDDAPRNVALLALPPSGNNAVIFDTSFSIEPFFGLAYTQRILGDRLMKSVNKQLVRELESRDIATEGLFDEIAENHGSLRGIARIPADVQRAFKIAHEISPEWHVRMQAAFQRHVDNAVTKTVNLPRDATPEQVSELYMLAWKLGCKGITVYRDTSRSKQAIEFTDDACDAPEGSCRVCAE